MLPTASAEDVWSAFVGEDAAGPAAQPCGLGARDTLRTEMGYLLSGQDFDPENEPRTPYEARIGFVVKPDTEFVGRDALERQREEGFDERFVGVRLLDRGVPRGGYAVTDGDLTRVGRLTSGTMSPTLDEPIGLGYLHEHYTEPGTEVSVVVRGDEKRAEVVIPPFLDR
jgi:aminomethyltransferase